MRKIVATMQSTLDNRIANADGGFWEPFPWGPEETAYTTELYRRCDTWALSRVLYQAIIPWWDTVAAGEVPADVATLSDADREFAKVQRDLTRVVFSGTLASDDTRTVIGGDLVPQLAALKQRPGRDILLSCGPATLGPLAAAPGLIDEYLVVLHPAVLAAGPRMFDGLGVDLAFELADSRVFAGGAVVLRYRVRSR